MVGWPSLTQWTWLWVSSGRWSAAVPEVTKCQTRLSDWATTIMKGQTQKECKQKYKHIFLWLYVLKNIQIPIEAILSVLTGYIFWFRWIYMLFLFSHSVMYDSLWPYELKHTRLPCPSPSLRACSNSCPLISPIDIMSIDDITQPPHPLSSPSPPAFILFPASGSFLMSQFFISGGQSIGALVSVPPMNIQGWFLLGLTGLISLQSTGLSRVFSSTAVQKHQFGTQSSLWYNSHICTRLLEKPRLWLYRPLSEKWWGQVLSSIKRGEQVLSSSEG